MKKLKLIAFLLLLIIAACTKDNDLQTDVNDNLIQEPLTGIEINQRIDKKIAESGRFAWLDADDFLLWSAAMRGDSILSIGFGKTPFETLKSTQTIELKNKIIEVIIENEKESSLKSQDQDLVLYEDPILNYIDVKISNIESIRELRKMEGIRYIEPAGYKYFAYASRYKSDSGCTTSQDAVNSNDYTAAAPNCLVSWTYDKHNIPSAWNYSTGAGVGVGLVDTGVSDYQDLLGSSFNDGYSSGRYILKFGVYVDSFWPWVTKTDGYHDKCGHGTLMAATIAAPRNDNGYPTGVAYNCNLISYRATKNVVLDGYHEQKGVAKAITQLGSRSDVKIISMSIGHIISIGSIEDAVKYAYAQGKLIIAAAGTSFEWSNWVGVIFPAWMAETVATTGVTDASSFEECAVCHKGDKVEFVAIMQRENDEVRRSVVSGYYANTLDYVGGSSVSASFTAGVAALIWARYPSWTREQVLNRMRQSASLYPNRSSEYGYGAIDVLEAVQ
jgi:subtilisin family serine protease